MRAPANVFDTISGLPLHPLVVHAAVVLIPLGAIGLVLTALIPSLRRRYSWLALLLFLIGAISVVVSKESGEQLAGHIGEPKDHAEWADKLTLSAFVTSLVAIAWYLLDRWHESRVGRTLHRQEEAVAEHDAELYAARDRAEAQGRSDDEPLRVGAMPHIEPPKRPALLGVLTPLTALLSLVTLGLVVATGHSGATATWEDQVAGWTSSGAGAPTASASATNGSYSLEQVAEHKTAADCWVAIKATGETATGVYDLTSWVTKHPGKEAPIIGLCGTDGTAKFLGKHGEGGAAGAPEKALANFKIGTIAD